MRTIRSLLVCGVLVSSVPLAAQPPGPKPVATILQLHEAMITPASDALFDVGREAPTDDAAWAAVRNQAVILAESGNLLMMERRAKDKAAWMKMAAELVDAAAAALRASEAKKVDAVVAAGDRIAASCETCHEPYRDGGRKMGPPPR